MTYDAPFLFVGHAGHLSHSLVQVHIEVLALGVDGFHAQTCQGLQELLVDEFHAFCYGCHVLCLLHRGQCAL